MRRDFHGPLDAKILILSEMPEVADEISGKLFVGPWGRMIKGLANTSWAKYGSTILNAACGSVMEHRPKGLKTGRLCDLYDKPKTYSNPAPELLENLRSLKQKIEELQPNIIIAIGPHVFNAITGHSDFESFRGYVTLVDNLISRPVKVLGTYHPERMMGEDYLRYVAIQDLRKALSESHSQEPTWTLKEVEADADLNTFVSYIKWLTAGAPDDSFPHREDISTGIAADIENVKGYNNHITQLGFGHSENFAVTFNWGKRFGTISAHEELQLYEALDSLSKTNFEFIFHNGIHDISVIYKNMGILFRNDFDTMIAGQMLWPEFRKSLAFLSSLCLNVPPWKYLDGEENYNAQDVTNTKALKPIFETLLKERGAEFVEGGSYKMFRSEMDQVPLAAMLQLQGVRVDPEIRTQILSEYEESKKKLLSELDDEIAKETGTPQKINFNSPKQVSELLYKTLKLPPQYKRRKSTSEVRKTSTDKEALIKLCRKTDSKIPQLIMEYKKTAKAISSYLSFELSPYNTVHTSYNIGSSVERFQSKKDAEDSRSLGRWSSSSSIIMPYGPGNLQSIPEYARKMFVPFEKGWEIACGDYVQAEAVIVAYLSDDKPLIEVIEKGNELRRKLRESDDPEEQSKIEQELQLYDIHRLKINQVMNIPILDVTKEQRKVGKILRHATNYDAGPAVAQALGAAVGIHEEVSFWKNLMARDMAVSPFKAAWHTKVRERMRQNDRTLTNCFGRVRKFLTGYSDEKLKDLWKRGYAFEPQSTIGDLLNECFNQFYKDHAGVIRLLLQLHDGGYISYPKEHRVKWIKLFREYLEREITINGYQVVIDIEFKAGPSWGEMQDVLL